MSPKDYHNEPRSHVQQLLVNEGCMECFGFNNVPPGPDEKLLVAKHTSHIFCEFHEITFDNMSNNFLIQQYPDTNNEVDKGAFVSYATYSKSSPSNQYAAWVAWSTSR